MEKKEAVKEEKPEAAPAALEKEEELAGKEVVVEKKEEIIEEKPEIKEPEIRPEIKKEIEEELKAEEKPVEEIKPEPVVKEEPKPVVEEPEEKKGFFAKIKEKIVTKKISEKQFEDMFWNLEIILLENNVAVEVIEKIKQDLKQILVDKPLPRTKITQQILDSLKNTIEGLFKVEKIDLIQKTKEKKPLVICFVGINGSGKTTTVAKMVKLFQNNGLSCVIAASDTFRAAAIDQLQKHADNLGIKLIKHDYGSDAAAVAFDAIKHAQSKNIDVVLIDTAGRIHSNINLMDEMKKIIRVAKPDLKIFVGESITGNDCTEQAKKFNETIGIDGIVLSKADIDEKGGAAISVSHITGKPILYLGTGQTYEDLKEFDPEIILKSLDLK
ncbi:signal recognition particle-docking protein FtsY [Candidatus Woesearchaeota archaeon]|nr:signal recognition particle-docking protein FtsY [Candidatus Woesearchaeota archaeon]